ncbi:LytR/AlgR family response regulator transcription factor [Flavobacterium difficile]|uniref:Response regulator transcription factor n=1 Tax=Flavobacterium difficile TaxID=2709659 RepID=A0ABX0I7L3_9FLAO|nr:LytTR family DNA-binding domain-containing protein [Flavobacterium difficile]NHM01480.1 response regulator transcription factor [Flavobacterium difficile]
MLISYIIIDATSTLNKESDRFLEFDELLCVGISTNYDDAIDLILEKKPQLIFFHFSNEIPLHLLLSVQQYLEKLPYVVAINATEEYAYKALKQGVMDYVLLPQLNSELRKSVLKFIKYYKDTSMEKLCIKSNGDYHFIPLDEIIYLKADNNTTDFYLQSGKIISGFKTMKFFEGQLPFYFFRVHNSYIVNIKFVTRINLGKFDCFLFDNMYKIPFSRTFRENIDAIIKRIGKI